MDDVACTPFPRVPRSSDVLCLLNACAHVHAAAIPWGLSWNRGSSFPDQGQPWGLCFSFSGIYCISCSARAIPGSFQVLTPSLPPAASSLFIIHLWVPCTRESLPALPASLPVCPEERVHAPGTFCCRFDVQEGAGTRVGDSACQGTSDHGSFP